MKGERVPSTLHSCSAMNLGTKSPYSNAVLEAKTAPSPNRLQNHLSTTPMDSVCNSNAPGTKSPLSISKLLPNLLKEFIEPRSAKYGLQDFTVADPPFFLMWLPGGSAKTRPAGHRRGRPPRTSCEHSWQKVLLFLHDGRRRGRPPRSAAELLLLSWSHRPKGQKPGRPPNNNPRSCSRPNLSFCILPFGHYLLSNCCNPHIKEGAQRLRPGESTEAWGDSLEEKHPYFLQLNWITPGRYHYVW